MASLYNEGGDVISPLGGYIPVVVLDGEDESNLQTLSQLQIYWRRFRSHRLALIGLATVVLLILMAVFAPLITPGVTPQTIPSQDLGVALGGPAHPPTFENFPWRLFGTTRLLNSSILAEITYGARVSLLISFSGAIISSVVGTILGGISGYFGGWVDNLIMRITDVFLTIPLLPLLIALSTIYDQGSVGILILIFGIFTWAGTARLVRASYLSMREQEFTEAARAAGVNDMRIIFRHILPNVLSPIIVVTTLSVAAFVTLESTLDFLGLGVKPPTVSWGNILTDAQIDVLVGDWWWVLFPGLFLVITVLAVNFIGDGLRDALDVRTRID
ncbi:MAG: ABC transporter permease [Ktedonobacterales bacterium]|nr:ABC transporter permease [Ktedonobacterales bacterium]